MKKTSEDEFYAELDKKTLRRSCCNCQTMLIFFGVLLVVSISFVYYCYREIKQSNLASKVVNFTFQDKENFYKKLMVASDDEKTFEITVASRELTAIMSEGISFQNLLLKNIQVIIRQEGIDIFGTLTKPLSSEVSIITVPEVSDGKVRLEVKKITAGRLSLPKYFNSKLAESLNSLMDKNFSTLYNEYEIEQIELKEDKMLIRGKLKAPTSR